MDKSKTIVTFLGILTLLAVGTFLKFAHSVVLPLVIAWLLSFILGPAVNFLCRHKVPIPLAIAFVLTILVFLAYHSGVFIIGRFKTFVVAYNERYEDLLSITLTNLSERFRFISNSFTSIDWGNRIRLLIAGFGLDVFVFLTKLVMVMIFLVFLLAGKPYHTFKIRKAFSQHHAKRVSDMLSAIAIQVGRYLSIQFTISLVTGVLVWLALTLIHVDFAVTWGAVAFLLNFIPTLGSIVASIPPILLALIQFQPSIMPAVLTAVSLLTIQMVMGNLVSPKIMGDNLNLSPVVVLLSLVFFYWMWGVVGALISVPITSAIKIVCENIEALRPISILMGSGKVYRKEFEDG